MRMDGGVRVPGLFDGMAAFPALGGATVLVRNHEIGPGDPARWAMEGVRAYDAGQPGGTSALVIGPDGRLLESYPTSAGTVTNCAGGATPWGTWLTCEEDVRDGHGYVFEVDPGDREGRLSSRPIRGMGRFSHEAVAVDPATGIVYLTEDNNEGKSRPGRRPGRLTSFLFRHVPEDRRPRPEALHAGGRLQALAVEERPRRAEALGRGRRLGVRWVDVEAENAHDDAVERGALRFARLEGADFAGGALWFSDTKGGEDQRGRVYRYSPARNALELFVEGTPANGVRQPDNLTVTPWGDVWFAEDRDDGATRIIGATPAGEVYVFASQMSSGAELAGPTFAADGQRFFVNLQTPGITLAVGGPFPEASTTARARMTHARPPEGLGPRLAPEMAEAGARAGLGPLEAAALLRAGVPLG